jgi:hypothetical protein
MICDDIDTMLLTTIYKESINTTDGNRKKDVKRPKIVLA